jgi:peptidoglycan glycosyltransferase
VVEARELTNDPGNPLVVAAARNAPRGRILDARGNVLARNVEGPNGTRLREYPYPAAAPIVGYKSSQFGTDGIEAAYDAELVGLSTLTPADEVLRKFRSDPYDPQDVVVSIDLRLQARAMQLLSERRGAVVAIEPGTGRILALASSPVYDPNRIVDPDSGAAYFEDLRDLPSEQSALVNRATRGRYTPGSVLKIVTAMAGLGSGTVEADTAYPEQPEEENEGFLVQGFRVRDAHHPSTGGRPVDLLEAIEVSCNIWFARTGLEIGGDVLREWARRVGFEQALPFDLPTRASFLTTGDGAEGGFADQVELANAAYGQGRTEVTPLQMALVASTVANDGTLMRPKLADALIGEDETRRDLRPEVLARVVGAADAATIQEAMNRAVEGELGRLFAGGAKVPGVPTAGKSGTAELGGEGEPHSWFIGFAPVEAPRIAVAVVIEEGGFGSEQAVPIGGDVMEFYLNLDVD